MILAVIQARMGSTRLPGKELGRDFRSAYARHVFNRVRNARLVDEVVVATTGDWSTIPLPLFARACTLPAFAVASKMCLIGLPSGQGNTWPTL